MARSTPTYTPIRNYAIGFFLSIILLFSDVSYGVFTPLRGYVNASTLYAQIISNVILENISNTFHSFKKNRNLSNENKELKEKILEIRTKEFIEKIEIKSCHAKRMCSSKRIINIFYYDRGSCFIFGTQEFI